MADLPAQVDGPDESLNEIKRATALKPLRVNNFRAIASAMKLSRPAARSVLDVGCAHGWFIEEAQTQSFQTIGIEPAKKNLEQVIDFKALGDIREGFFPNALRADERFDFIVFNDVFEHLPDIREAIKACHRHLNPNGILILNLPNSQGIFYRIASLLAFLGILGPFERLWQKGFPSPHLTYFNPKQLRDFVTKNGFRSTKTVSLKIISLHGLWERLRFDQSSSVFTSAVTWLILVLTAPLWSLLPSDIHCEFFEKT